MNPNITLNPIDPIHKGMSLFLSYTNMNTMNRLHHVKEHSKISHFLQFEILREFFIVILREKILVSFKRPCPN